MNTLKGTSAYWKRFLLEVLAMIKQLDLPAFFITLLCADLRWHESIEIIYKLSKGGILTDDDIHRMNYFKKTKILNSQQSCSRSKAFSVLSRSQNMQEVKSCRKYKNMECRYSFRKYFTDHTIIAHPLSDKLSVEEKALILQQRKRVEYS